MDVYFEKIAGVAEPVPEQPAQIETAGGPQIATERGLDENGFPTSPMSEQDGLWFVQASRLHKPLVRAAHVAALSGGLLMCMGVPLAAFALVMLLLAPGSEGIVPLVVGLFFCGLGWLERSSGRDLMALDVGAPLRMAIPQLVILALVVAQYFLFMVGVEDQVAQAMSEQPPEVASQMAAQMEVIGPWLGKLSFVLTVGLSLLFQGGLALYYLTRKRHIAILTQELPPWVTGVIATVHRS